jgi:carbon-monoxide dehydrogenase large subunit
MRGPARAPTANETERAALVNDPTRKAAIERFRHRTQEPLVRGEGSYVADVRLPRMLEMTVVRSDIANGRIAAVDCTRARAMEGVVAAVAARDLDGVQEYPSFLEFAQPLGLFPLCRDRVRYVGAPLAAIVASDRYVGEDAAETVAVEIEELPAVTTLDQALAPDAPRLFDTWPDNRILSFLRRDEAVDDILASSRVVRGAYKMQRQSPSPMETRGAVAEYRGGRLTLWTSTQSPHIVRTTISLMLGLPEHAIRVVAEDLGGSFGTKTHVYPEEILVCWLARRLGRPVRWVEDRAEHLMASVHARDQLHELEAAIDDDGRVLALRARIVCDVGSGEIFIPSLTTSFVTAAILTGPYRIPHAEVAIECVVTNKTPSGAYRGFGAPEAVFAMERLVERIARKTGRDSIELRRGMMIGPEDLPYTLPSGAVLDSGSHRQAFERAVELGRAALERAHAERAPGDGTRLGLGVATYVEGGGPSYYLTTGHWTSHEPCGVRVEPDGGVVVAVGVTAMGQGIQTAVATVAADALGVPADTVRVVLGDTDTSPYGLGSWGSRGAIVATGAVVKAMATVRDKALRIGAGLLEAAPEDVVLEHGRIFVRGSTAPSVSFAEVATVATIRTTELPPGIEPGLEGSAVYDAPGVMHASDERGRLNAVAAHANATHAAVVQVDVETGWVEVLEYVVVHDCGTMLNPAIVDGQIRGGVAQGIGGALYEEISYSPEGQPLTTSFMDYLLPTAAETPPIVIEHFESPSPTTALGVKGVGESGPIGPPAAITNAIADALAAWDIEIDATPVTPTVVRRLIRAAEASPTGTSIAHEDRGPRA